MLSAGNRSPDIFSNDNKRLSTTYVHFVHYSQLRSFLIRIGIKPVCEFLVMGDPPGIYDMASRLKPLLERLSKLLRV